ncbi:disulfide bond formation protein B [Pseudoroseomonas wenyumeiae]|uniref:Disulfide bond formation protein B n=1 Tax=Teichococcus wenyumeiae TaxID=2478470 RepID=A0A3A9JK33_9PROT|nr:disulfide bond formation protein B [Pseudoroseomonas wenyumeiae]RKK05143.1 disulfide bond formation protein B [Pseudoroseomonas wenyumeiae]RMI20033.1 disulfide bond formation protein B [Pseudoroseomonas wenyumeiae]
MPLLIAILAATAPLAAMATERWGGLNPCLLCLWQRWPYWVAAVLALLAYLLPRRLMLALAGLAILTSGAFAVVHLGVEAKWWPSPLPGCVAPNASAGQSVEEMLASLSPRPAKPCDEPTYLVSGLPISMAGMNLIYAVALGGVALWGARRLR